MCEGTLKNLLFLAKYVQAWGGVCFSLGSCRGRVLDTMQVEVVYCRGGSRRVGGGVGGERGAVRQGRKAAGTERVNQVTIVGS